VAMSAVSANLEAIAARTQMAVEGMHAELSAGLAQFQAGLRIDGARYVNPGRGMLTNGRARLVGWSLRATGGAVAATLHNGTDATGDVVAVLDLDPAAGRPSQTVTLTGPGISCPAGLFIAVSGPGQLVGAVHLGAVD
jgi:hypothetical protein